MNSSILILGNNERMVMLEKTILHASIVRLSWVYLDMQNMWIWGQCCDLILWNQVSVSSLLGWECNEWRGYTCTFMMEESIINSTPHIFIIMISTHIVWSGKFDFFLWYILHKTHLSWRKRLRKIIFSNATLQCGCIFQDCSPLIKYHKASEECLYCHDLVQV